MSGEDKASAYLDLAKQQLAHELQAIKMFIKHGPTKGDEAERLFVNTFLRKHLPKRYSIGRGFIEYRGELTPQLDVIIHDESLNTPSYTGVESCVFKPGAVYGAMELTMKKLDRAKLDEDIEKISMVRKILPDRLVPFVRVFNEKSEKGKGWVVKSEIIHSKPVPRTYIGCLSGSTYGSIDALAADVQASALKHGAHVHGLLVLNPDGPDWFLAMQAYQDGRVMTNVESPISALLQSMQQAFMGMNVGRLPAAPT